MYAALDLPHLASTENVGQLRLLLGHLRLQDKTADLILIDISYIQLLVGSSTLFFNLPYTKYKWLVDTCWLTSIWAFLSTINFQLAIKEAYNPPLQRTHDVALMDFFVSQNYDRKRLMAINRCRVFLKVLFLSDICSADGTKSTGLALLTSPSSIKLDTMGARPCSFRETRQIAATTQSMDSLQSPGMAMLL